MEKSTGHEGKFDGVVSRRDLLKTAVVTAGLATIGLQETHADGQVGSARSRKDRKPGIKNQEPALEPLKQPTKEALSAAIDEINVQPTTTSTFPEELQPIDHRVFQSDTYKLRFAPNTIKEKFRFWQVETLLNQASDLLERGIRDRSAYEDLRVKWTILQYETKEFDILQRIHDDEIAAGWYTLNRDQSEPEEAAEIAVRDKNNEALHVVNKVLSSEFSDVDHQAGDAAILAKISAYTTYQGQHAAGIRPSRPFKVTIDGGSTVAMDVGFNHSGETLVAENGDAAPDGQPGGKPKTQRVHELARSQALHGLNIQAATLQAQLSTTTASRDAAAHLVDARTVKATWDEHDVEFRRKRSEAAVFMNELKKEAMHAPGGPYNYLEQMRPIRERFRRDFADAYVRLSVAAQGLGLLYDYNNDPLPDFSGVATTSFFDDCLIWTRDAIRFLATFGQLDQNYALTIPVRRVVGEGQWQLINDIAKRTHDGPLKMSFEVPDSLFPTQRFVRLRGISVVVTGHDGHGDGVWRVTVRPPSSAICRFLSDPDGHLGHPLDQQDAPPCVSGRVMTRESERDPDIVGITALHNISPLGDLNKSDEQRKWSIVVDRFSSSGKDATRIDDVQIDLLLAMRSIV